MPIDQPSQLHRAVSESYKVSSLIPCPRRHARTVSGSVKQPDLGLINLMRLQRRPETFEHFTTIVRESVNELDFKIPFIDQQRRFLALMCTKLPILRDYADCWPVEEYLYLYLRTRLSSSEMRYFFCSKLVQKKVNDDTRQSLAIVKYEAEPPTPRNFVQSFLESLSPPQPALYGLFCSLGIADKKTFDAFACLFGREHWLRELVAQRQMTWFQKALLSQALVVYMRTRSPTNDSALEVEYTSIASLLVSIRPPLPHLIPLFRELGITDKASFEALAYLTAGDAELAELAADHQMTPLEAKIIGEAFSEMRKAQMHL